MSSRFYYSEPPQRFYYFIRREEYFHENLHLSETWELFVCFWLSSSLVSCFITKTKKKFSWFQALTFHVKEEKILFKINICRIWMNQQILSFATFSSPSLKLNFHVDTSQNEQNNFFIKQNILHSSPSYLHGSYPRRTTNNGKCFIQNRKSNLQKYENGAPNGEHENVSSRLSILLQRMSK